LLKYPKFSGWCTYINKHGHVQVRSFYKGKEEKKPKDTTQKQWVKGHKKWKDSKKKVISGNAYEINADGTEVENESTK